MMMRGLATAFILVLTAAPSGALTMDDLQGITIQTRVNYDMRIRRKEGTFDTQMTMVWKFKFDETGRVTGDMTRTVTTPRGPRTRTTPMKGRIGKPGEPATGGQGIWLIDGEKLILLRAFDAGGFKAEIEFSGAPPQMKCTIRAPFVREEGSANIRAQSVVGGPVTILSARQTSSDCRVAR
jgi:hypothetical protein